MILFAALLPPPGVAKAVRRIQKGVPGARWHPSEKLHITVGYFGEVSDTLAEELDEELARKPMPALELYLDGVGHFGRAEPHQLHCRLREDTGLSRLHQHCRRSARELRISMDARGFIPHLTLAYLKPFPDVLKIAKWEQKHAALEVGPFLIDRMVLMSSHRTKAGPNRYDVEASYPLLGA